MKKLSEITKKDAIEIIKSVYPNFFYQDANWKLTDAMIYLCMELYADIIIKVAK